MKNNTDLRIMLKEAGILFGITLIAGLLLGFVSELTKEPIRIQKEKAIQKACTAVFKDAGEFRETEYQPTGEVSSLLAETGVKIGTVFEAYSDADQLLGYVIETTSTQGYGGNIVLYAGVTLEGTLNDISILEISETAGLGMKAEKVLVPQFHQKTAEAFTYTKNGSTSPSEIDAISGATVTTKAVTNAVNGSLLVSKQLIQGGGGNEESE